MRFSKKLAALLAVPFAAVAIAGCSEGPPSEYDAVQDEVKETRAEGVYRPKNGIEFRNYNEAQKLYDDPASIQWCTTTWGNANSPLVTVPIRGKLTSSSVSYFPNYGQNSYGSYELRSVDGMFHGSPPGYRYGFTPGGQYVDFFNMATFCTTSLTKFQRENSEVTIRIESDADNEAERLLGEGKDNEAQAALERSVGGN